MKSKDQILLEEAYKLTIAQQRIKDYIQGGCKGDLLLSHLKGRSITLPDNLTVNGILNLSYTKTTSLPKNLKVKSHLLLRKTEITSLPEDIKVGGTLYLYLTPITHLPDNLTVGKHLDLSFCQYFKSFPKNLKVGGNLYMNNETFKLEDIKYPIEVRGIVYSHTFTDEEFKEYNEKLRKYENMKKKLPELEEIF